MTAREILARLGELGVVVRVQDGQPRFVPHGGGKFTDVVAKRVKELAAHVGPVRSQFLELVGCDLWDKGAAIRRMIDTDGKVDRWGANGTDPEIQAAAAQASAAYMKHDRQGLDEWLSVIEGRALELKRRAA